MELRLDRIMFMLTIFALYELGEMFPITIPSSSHTKQEEVHMIKNSEEIIKGNFSALGGQWVNKSENLRAFISENEIYFDGKKYALEKGEAMKENTVRINMVSYTGVNDPTPLKYYPKGSIIPVKQSDGTILTDEYADPTDTSKDRIVLANISLTSDELEKATLYAKDK